ncbi:putative cytochrome P450 oxidoreductase [Cryphonectria parasitica EP155]|uniref:Cytochrome P450 oxidoreductase n=1 Tax=Cryphonectria parasitica (strain ATCC 38755 / EP155) TaxID=660469 RepID=A0A9P4XSA2_CRYP1|nr:putative cytochrome P450 oxidoreductase [Cryphonectria parasitica EP155]KAF3760019.1 putative cytochrome P450 oxidoreductase [Cryphonectria parasitica EP155]
MTALQLLAALLLVLLTTTLFHLYRLAYRRRPYPGIPYNPSSTRRLLGDIPELTAAAQAEGDPSRMTRPQFAHLGAPVIQLFLAPFWRPMVYVNDTQEVEDLLQNRTREFDKSRATIAPFRPLVPGASICKVKGLVWRAQVRLWTDVISVGYLRDVAAPVMHRAASDLVTLFAAKTTAARGRPFWVAEDFKIATFEVIWKAMLGSDLRMVEAETEAVLAAVGSLPPPTEGPDERDEPLSMPTAPRSDEWEAAVYFLSLIPSTLMSPVPGLLHFYYSLTPTWRRHWATKTRLMRELIESSKARFADLGERKNDESIAEKRDVCALDRALRRFAKVSPADIYRPTTDDMYDELFLLLMSGHETTATLLAWMAKILTQNQVEQTKLRAALRAHFLATPKTPDVQAILTAEIPYLDASVEELVRVGNIIPEVVRETSCDTELLGRRIPKGATVVCSTYVAHEPFGDDVVPESARSENSRANKGGYRTVWEADMADYHPERWIRDDGTFDAKAVPKLAFSAGPRGCFGRKFASQQFRIMLVILTLNFEFLPLPQALDSNDAFSKLTRSPCQCYARMKQI